MSDRAWDRLYVTLILFVLCAAVGFVSALPLWRDADEPASTHIDLSGDPAEADDPAPAGPEGLPGHSTPSDLRLGFVGDLLQHRRQREDHTTSYQDVADLLRGFDLLCGNLEFPVHPERPIGPPPGSARFNGSATHLDALAQAGFDVLWTSNNHAFDQGLEGIAHTNSLVAARSMRPVGTGSPRGPVLVEVKGYRLALVAYSGWMNAYRDATGEREYMPRSAPVDLLHFAEWQDEYRREGLARFAEHVAQARQARADLIVAHVHWGKEWSFQPTDDQRRAAHDMIDAGFDLIVGDHPHVLNPPELYRGKLIAYSLGNLVCDFEPWQVRTAAVLEVRIGRGPDARGRVVDFAFFPTHVRRSDHRVLFAEKDQRPWRLARRILGPAVRAPR